MTVFQLSDTHGLPLSETVARLHGMGAVVAWDRYAAEAIRAGWTPEKIRSTVREALVEVHGPAEESRIVASLNRMLRLAA